MSSYVKRIALIKSVSAGFESTGAPLSGMVKAEKYGSTLYVETSLINFAPLSEGKYICAVTDGEATEIFDCPKLERGSELSLSEGFASIICFVKDGVKVVASAVSGNCASYLTVLKEQVERAEVPKKIAYEDEAISEENYYEFDSVKDGGAVGKTEKEEAARRAVKENENAFCAVQNEEKFYSKIAKEVERIFEKYPPLATLAEKVEGSRWAKIDYDEDKYYAFGVIYGDGEAKYLCYGVPCLVGKSDAEFKRYSTLIPTDDGGYYVCFQSALTGKAVKNL